MDFSEAAIGSVLWKKLFLKISQYSQESCRPATLLKALSNTGVFLWILQNFYEHLFRRKSAQWTAASVVTFILSSHNLLTGYEKWRYSQFNRNLSICVSLPKDWFILHKKFNQDLAT